MTAPTVDARLIRIFARLKAIEKRSQSEAVVERVPEKLRHWRGFSDFALQHLRIKPKEESADLIPFRLNWVQRQIWANELRLRRAGKPVWQIILKYRKPGVTTLEQGASYWECWRHKHRECLTLAHEPDAQRIIFRMVGRFYDAQPEDYRHKKSEAVVGHIEFPDWGSLYMSGTAGRKGVKGRGGTFARVHLSEAAHYIALSEVHTGLAESIGSTSAYILESTGNGREGDGQTFFEFYQAAKLGRNQFTPLFFAWHDDPANRLPLEAPDEIDDQLDPEALHIMERFSLSKEQMKWWLAKRLRLVADSQSASKIHQEFPSDDESAFLFGTPGYYDVDLCRALEAKCRPPIAVEENGRLKIWEVPDDRYPAPYIIGADVSEGVGKDDAGAVVINAATGRQAASWRWNRMPPGDFGRVVLAGLGMRYANPATNVPAFIICEANNHGHAAHVGLLNLAQYPRERVYHHTDDAKVDTSGLPTASTSPGWTNNVKTHTDLTDAVGRILREGQPQILDVDTVRSIMRVGSGPSGAVFKGRDLAVSAGLTVIGFPYARERSTTMFVGGQIVHL